MLVAFMLTFMTVGVVGLRQLVVNLPGVGKYAGEIINTRGSSFVRRQVSSQILAVQNRTMQIGRNLDTCQLMAQRRLPLFGKKVSVLSRRRRV